MLKEKSSSACFWQNLFSSHGIYLSTEERTLKFCEEIILVVVFSLEAELMLCDLCRAKALIFSKVLCCWIILFFILLVILSQKVGLDFFSMTNVMKKKKWWKNFSAS